MNALPIGTRLGEFELTRTLGDGGFGIVYLAWDHSLERSVALKEYMPSSIAARHGGTEIKPFSERHQDTFDTGMRSFINEAKLLARFDHPALVKVYRFWEAHGTAYMVMPFYEGKTLRDTVRARGEPPDEAWLLALLAPLLDALTVLHANQCYHRDIAPDNIVLLADEQNAVQNAGVRPLLLDFGAARRVIGETTQALTAILKPGYAPVEQYAEVPGLKQGGWTDVYALAAVVHWAITGKTPPNSVSRMFSDTYVPLAEAAAGRYSEPFLAAIDRALAVLPDDRTQSVGALRIELQLDDGERTVAPSPATWADPDATVVRPPSRTRPPGAVPRSGATAQNRRPGGAAGGLSTGVSPAGSMATGGAAAIGGGATGSGATGGAATRGAARTSAAGSPAIAQEQPAAGRLSTAAVPPTAASLERAGGGDDDDNATVIAAPPPSPAVARPVESAAVAAAVASPAVGQTHKRFPVGRVLAAAALAAGAAALWWVLQRSPSAPTSAPLSPAPQQVPSTQQAPTDATPNAPVTATPPSASATAAVPAGGTAAATDGPAQAVPRPSPGTVQQQPPAASAAPAGAPSPPLSTDGPSADAPRATAVARPRQEPARAAPRAAAPAKAEQRPAGEAGGNRAECARILQQMSLGDSSPELFARGKALGCR